MLKFEELLCRDNKSWGPGPHMGHVPYTYACVIW